MSTEHNTATLLAQKMFADYAPYLFCVLSSLVWPTTLSFNRNCSLTYCS